MVNQVSKKLYIFILLFFLGAGFVFHSLQSKSRQDDLKQLSKLPQIIAHRGFSGKWPEHTLKAYEDAERMGVDFIEPDLVVTRDKILIARHDFDLSKTTNVADIFPKRKRTIPFLGSQITAYFVQDFTLEEIKKLEARQRFFFRPQVRGFQIMTFEEILQSVIKWNQQRREKGRSALGVYPEIKFSRFFKEQGIDMVQLLVDSLNKFNCHTKEDPIIIQSAELETTKRLFRETRLQIAQVLQDPRDTPDDQIGMPHPWTYESLMTPEGLKYISEFASILIAHKIWFRPPLFHGSGRKRLDWVQDAGLKLNIFTFRDEPQFISPGFDQIPTEEYLQYFAFGADAVFTDNPDTAIKARSTLLNVHPDISFPRNQFGCMAP